MDEQKQNDLQQKYMEFQAIDQQIKQMEQQVEAFDGHLQDIADIKEALDEMKDVKPGTEVLVPLSQGIFMRAQVTNPDSLVVNVGGKATVEKDIAGTKKILDDQLTEIENARTGALATLQKITQKAQELQTELERLVK